MSIELKSIFFRVGLVSTIVAAMPIGFAKTPAQAEKVLRVAFPAPDDGFDMVKTFNFYSGNVADVIFERLVQYDYLANPVKLVPATAQSLPVIEKNGQVYTFKIKSGIYFTDDPAFKGKGMGEKLVIAGAEYARKENLKILPLCPFAKNIFSKNKEIQDVRV
mgnify:CR=1 FL=1